eukprot:7761843-Pyramimonas_sp.AAC.1
MEADIAGPTLGVDCCTEWCWEYGSVVLNPTFEEDGAGWQGIHTSSWDLYAPSPHRDVFARS